MPNAGDESPVEFGFNFYNTSRYDFEKLLADAPHLTANLRNYIASFSPNMREMLETFDFDNTIIKPDEAGLLFQVLERFKHVDLHPDAVDNPTMGTIFEELIRRFNEALNENPGEHFTPRDVVHLMVDLLLAGDEDRIRTSREGEHVKIYLTTHFGFRKITAERPLRLNFQASAECIARLEEEKAFQNLVQSKKKGAVGAKEQAEGRAEQEAIRRFLRTLPDTLHKDRDEFDGMLKSATKRAGLMLSAPIAKAIPSALSERVETAAICRDKPALSGVEGDGNPGPDPELRDTESVPLSESFETFFEREVKPHVPDAWIDTSKRDEKEGQVGIVGQEINLSRYFCRHTPPRPLEEIEAGIRTIEKDIMEKLRDITN